jgi:hypothetical protein
LTEAEIDYYLNRSRYSLATKNVHFVKGTLLEYDGVYLAEGPWPGEAYHDAAKREKSRSRPVPLNYASSKAPRVSRGPFGQHTEAAMPIHAAPVEGMEEALPLEPSENLPPPESVPQNDGPSLEPRAGSLPAPLDFSKGKVQGKPAAPAGQKSNELTLTAGEEAAPAPGAKEIRFRRGPSAEPSKAPTAPHRLPPATQR